MFPAGAFGILLGAIAFAIRAIEISVYQMYVWFILFGTRMILDGDLIDLNDY
jgi:hypothetical protein